MYYHDIMIEISKKLNTKKIGLHTLTIDVRRVTIIFYINLGTYL